MSSPHWKNITAYNLEPLGSVYQNGPDFKSESPARSASYSIFHLYNSTFYYFWRWSMLPWFPLLPSLGLLLAIHHIYSAEHLTFSSSAHCYNNKWRFRQTNGISPLSSTNWIGNHCWQSLFPDWLLNTDLLIPCLSSKWSFPYVRLLLRCTLKFRMLRDMEHEMYRSLQGWTMPAPSVVIYCQCEVEAVLMEYKPNFIISVHLLMQYIPLWVLKWKLVK